MHQCLLWTSFAALSGICCAASHAAVAPDMVLAQTYDASARADPSLYWISEKLDGVRAFWDGRELRFRSGRRIEAPAWFTAVLPPEALDGELWLGRGRFDELSGIVRTTPAADDDWRRVSYRIFELPGAPGAFSERIERIQALVRRTDVAWLQAIPQFRVPDAAALKKALDEIVQAGGEGLMLHRADAVYVSGRNDALLKFKPQQDAEAIVVGYTPGKGRFQGHVGALLLQMPDGKRFRLGSGLSAAERERPPPLGAVVSYRYQSLTPDGKPRFARYWRRSEAF